MAKLIAIDGNSLMHRAFYALPAMTNREGTPTGAIYGFFKHAAEACPTGA